MKTIFMLIVIILSFGLMAMTKTFKVLNETKLPDGNVIMGVHYSDEKGTDEVVIVKMSQIEAKNNTVFASIVLKEVLKVGASRHYKKHSIKNDPVFKHKIRSLTIKE